jgi:hypothetical protein
MLENATTFAQGAQSSWKRADPATVDSRSPLSQGLSRGNDGYAGRLPFAVAKVAQCLAGFLHSRAVHGQLREEPGEDEGGER